MVHELALAYGWRLPHDLVRPVPRSNAMHRPLLGDPANRNTRLYEDLGAFRGRIRVSVPRMSVGEAASSDDICTPRACYKFS
jgi:hypothetical protein